MRATSSNSFHCFQYLIVITIFAKVIRSIFQGASPAPFNLKVEKCLQNRTEMSWHFLFEEAITLNYVSTAQSPKNHQGIVNDRPERAS